MKLNHSTDNQTPPVNVVKIARTTSLQEAADFVEYVSIEKPYGYMYLTNHLDSCKVYIGLHSEPKFDKSYLGSGLNIVKAIKKYGRKAFSVMPLVYCATIEELNRVEKELIARYRVALGWDNVYNIDEGGYHEGMAGVKRSEETRRKSGDKIRGQKRSQESKERIRIARLGQKHSEETKQKLKTLAEKNKERNILTHTGTNSARYGKKHTPETLAKMRESAQNRPPVTEETKAKLRACSLGKTAWNKGIPQTEEVKAKLSAILSGRTLTEEHKKKISDWNQKHPLSAEARKRLSDIFTGRTVSEETRKKLSEAGKGRVLSEASRQKMSLSAQARRKKIVAVI